MIWRRWLILFCSMPVFLIGCATDVVVTQGAAAEQKKKDQEEVDARVDEIEKKVQETQDLQEKRKKNQDEDQ